MARCILCCQNVSKQLTFKTSHLSGLSPVSTNSGTEVLARQSGWFFFSHVQCARPPLQRPDVEE